MLDRRVVAGQQNGDGDEETSSVQFRHFQVDRDTSPFSFRKAESRIQAQQI